MATSSSSSRAPRAGETSSRIPVGTVFRVGARFRNTVGLFSEMIWSKQIQVGELRSVIGEDGQVMTDFVADEICSRTLTTSWVTRVLAHSAPTAPLTSPSRTSWRRRFPVATCPARWLFAAATAADAAADAAADRLRRLVGQGAARLLVH